MRIYLSAAILLGLLAGCSADQDSSTSKTTASASSALQQGATSQFAGRSAMTGFASLPDRGELLAYNQTRGVKHSGAYTAYPVALSEAHALDAMRTGEMVVKAPDGELIRLKYERHIEHPDGNWTWIGRNADGADAVLTFGEKAVFGTIPQGVADTLRLTMSAGQAFLVATDRSKLAGLDGMARRKGTDQLIPPRLAAATSGRTTASMQAEATGTQSASAASTALVDVLLGYTNGFSTQLGGDSQAITRLVNMTDITNQAYVNSGVTMRVRLVGTLKVTYPDNTDNGDALEKLTGYSAGSNSSIPVDPAFNALRAKRDELGADLVSLVRAFRTPENDGCGIAWLIGGGGYAIETADAPYGYSVVSDGTDLDEGDNKTYFCREETLAHEFGHNMGQAHNTEDSNGSGTHSYSYGYRESTTGGFYTVMAYPKKDANQFAIRYFANPGVQYSGRPTGVANQSDNVRSMNISMPLVAGFRDTVVPVAGQVHNDVNGDGVSDVLWRNGSTGANAMWRSANSATTQPVNSVADLNWKVVGSGDFDGDGKSDLLWRNSSFGANVIWLAANSTTPQAVTPVANLDWKVAGVGDFDGDGKSDILWRNSSTGQNLIWKSGNNATQQAITDVPNVAWIVAGVGDFNKDGKSDILWRNTQTGANTAWKSGSSASVLNVTPVGDQAWKVAGIGDFDGDGAADILWRHQTTGANTIWKSGNSTTVQTVASVASQNWIVAAVGDYNGDGKSDILWRYIASGNNVIWRSANSSTTQAVTAVGNLSWFVAQ